MKSWDDLRLFLAVARSGTLTSAASELACSVSTLHRHLAAFEGSIGAKLFEKGPRGYQLTNAGEALLPRAEEAEEAVLGASRAVVGTTSRRPARSGLPFPRSCSRPLPLTSGPSRGRAVEYARSFKRMT